MPFEQPYFLSDPPSVVIQRDQQFRKKGNRYQTNIPCLRILIRAPSSSNDPYSKHGPSSFEEKNSKGGGEPGFQQRRGGGKIQQLFSIKPRGTSLLEKRGGGSRLYRPNLLYVHIGGLLPILFSFPFLFLLVKFGFVSWGSPPPLPPSYSGVGGNDLNEEGEEKYSNLQPATSTVHASAPERVPRK